MDLNNVLKNMEEKTGKSWTYLKGLFNSANSEYAEQFGDALPDEQRMILALNKVGKKYDLTKTDIDDMMTDAPALDYAEASTEDIKLAEEIEEMFEEEEDGLIITDDPNFDTAGISNDGSPSAWKKFLSTIPDPTKGSSRYKKTPSLIVDIGPTYYLKMTDPKSPPPEGREFEGKYGSYTKYPFKVTLIKVSDEDMYDVVYKGGNFEGKKAFVNGQEYTVWLDEKSAGFYKIFWLNTTSDGLPDDRAFTYKFSKKGGYNVYTYKEANI